MLETFVQWLLDQFRDLGYPGIVVLMAVESSFLPLPSELVMPPAGYLAAKGEMSLGLAIACGVLGSVLGALANYGLAKWLGRAVLHRLARYVLVSEASLDRSERFFNRHGEISTFLSRMLPVVRHLISIPAGLARMPLARFIVFTGGGALIWCSILAGVGFFLGRHEDVLSAVGRADVERVMKHVFAVLIPCLVAISVGYVIWNRQRRGRERRAAGPSVPAA